MINKPITIEINEQVYWMLVSEAACNHMTLEEYCIEVLTSCVEENYMDIEDMKKAVKDAMHIIQRDKEKANASTN